jgi:uncharacterized protein YegL
MANKKKKVTTTVTTTVTEEIINVPTNDKTQIICILDKSGSMSGIISDSIGGFNTFLKQQRELKDEATITVALFDDTYELLYDNIDIKKAEDLTNKTWIPRGTTALYDAIGKTINTVKAKHAKLGNERPSKVLVCIVTDGLENASQEYKLSDIKKLIKDCEEDDWNFIYLAANQDAFAVSNSFGVSAGNTINYTATAQGVSFMTSTLSNASVSYRSMSTSNADFKTRSKFLIDTGDGKDEPKDNSNLTINDGTYTTGSINTASGTNPSLNVNGTNITTGNVTVAPDNK